MKIALLFFFFCTLSWGGEHSDPPSNSQNDPSDRVAPDTTLEELRKELLENLDEAITNNLEPHAFSSHLLNDPLFGFQGNVELEILPRDEISTVSMRKLLVQSRSGSNKRMIDLLSKNQLEILLAPLPKKQEAWRLILKTEYGMDDSEVEKTSPELAKQLNIFYFSLLEYKDGTKPENVKNWWASARFIHENLPNAVTRKIPGKDNRQRVTWAMRVLGKENWEPVKENLALMKLFECFQKEGQEDLAEDVAKELIKRTENPLYPVLANYLKLSPMESLDFIQSKSSYSSALSSLVRFSPKELDHLLKEVQSVRWFSKLSALEREKLLFIEKSIKMAGAITDPPLSSLDQEEIEGYEAWENSYKKTMLTKKPSERNANREALILAKMPTPTPNTIATFKKEDPLSFNFLTKNMGLSEEAAVSLLVQPPLTKADLYSSGEQNKNLRYHDDIFAFYSSAEISKLLDAAIQIEKDSDKTIPFLHSFIKTGQEITKIDSLIQKNHISLDEIKHFSNLTSDRRIFDQHNEATDKLFQKHLKNARNKLELSDSERRNTYKINTVNLRLVLSLIKNGDPFRAAMEAIILSDKHGSDFYLPLESIADRKSYYLKLGPSLASAKNTLKAFASYQPENNPLPFLKGLDNFKLILNRDTFMDGGQLELRRGLITGDKIIKTKIDPHSAVYSRGKNGFGSERVSEEKSAECLYPDFVKN
jgi:hypothetical protein